MLDLYAKNWGWVALRGLLSIIFGILVFFNPFSALTALLLFLGVYFLIDGGMTLYYTITGRSETERGWWSFLEGALSIIAGIAAIITPLLAGIVLATFFAILFGVWAIVTGVTQIITAVRLREEIEGEFWMGLAGILSVIFGTFIALNPLISGIVLTQVVGIYAVLFGIMLVMLALRLRSFPEETRSDEREMIPG